MFNDIHDNDVDVDDGDDDSGLLEYRSLMRKQGKCKPIKTSTSPRWIIPARYKDESRSVQFEVMLRKTIKYGTLTLIPLTR